MSTRLVSSLIERDLLCLAGNELLEVRTVAAVLLALDGCEVKENVSCVLMSE